MKVRDKKNLLKYDDNKMNPFLGNFNISEINSPFFIFDRIKLKKNLEFFLKHFCGECIYSVKTNPHTSVLKTIYDGGVTSFDVASINEVKLIKSVFPDSRIYFMNPVKSVQSIKDSYFNFGVRDFALDCKDELKKIVKATKGAKDLNLHIRISTYNIYSKVNLSKKFGIDGQDADILLKDSMKYSKNLGISFHVGSQCMSPNAYTDSINKVCSILKKSKVKIKYFNIGGGFPGEYIGLEAPHLLEYLRLIKLELNKNNIIKSNIKILSEPGRVLVYNCMSMIVKVILKKENKLFINDGTHGYLSDSKRLGLIQPVRLFKKKTKAQLVPYSFYGQTCDSNDFIEGPYYIPDSVKIDDLIEIDLMGAYTLTMKNDFNGFYSSPKVFMKEKSSRRFVDESLAIHKTSPFILQKNET